MGLKTETNNLTSQIITYLNDVGYFAWRNNNVGIYDEESGRWRTNNSIKGTADIFCLLPPDGKMLFIEVKVGSDRVKEKQILFSSEVRKRGALYWVVKNIDEFIVKYRELYAQITAKG